jgi:hypothetical protein
MPDCSCRGLAPGCPLVLFGIHKLGDAVAYFHTHQWQFVDFSRRVGLPAPVIVAFVQT